MRMSTSIVTGDGYGASSNHESAEDMVRALKPIPDSDPGPRVIQDRGKVVEEKDAAAVALGKKGGEAAAAKRVADAKEAAKVAKAEPAEGDEPEPSAVEAAPKQGNPRHDAQARITELARKAKDATDRAERAEARTAEIERQRSAPAPRQEARPEPAAPRQDLADPKPNEDAFATYAEFLDARDDWRDRQKERQAAERQHAQADDEYVDSVVNGFLDRVAGVPRSDPGQRQKLTEFMDRIDPEVAGLTPSFELKKQNAQRKLTGLAPIQAGPLNAIADEIVQSEHAPALLLHFTAHPEEFQRVAALRTPREIQRAMATIETRLEDADAATIPERAQSRAKPPVRAVTGSPHAAETAPDPDDASPGAYERHTAYWSKR